MLSLPASSVLFLACLAGCTSPEKSHIRESDEAIVNKALDFYSHGKVSRESLRKTHDINVVYLPEMTCVGLNLKARSAGGDDTVCLDKSGQRVVLQYTNGD